MRTNLPIPMVVACAIGGALAARDVAGGAQSRPEPMTVVVKLDLFLQSYPHLSATGGQYGVPPVLYPEHVNLQGLVYYGGPAGLLDTIDTQIQRNRGNREALAALLGLKVERQEGERWVDVPQAANALELSPAAGYEHFFWRFEIRVADRTAWPDGKYRVGMSTGYDRGGTRETCSSGPWPFVIRTFRANSAEEINFLTSLSLGQPANVAARQMQDHPELAGSGIYEQLVKLDPYDVYPRSALAKIAHDRMLPEEEVQQYVKIKELFEKGYARRLESLVLPAETRAQEHVPLPDRSRYVRIIDERLDGGRKRAQIYKEAREQVEEALATRGQAAIGDLLSNGNQWVRLAMVREIGRGRTRDAYEPLVRKLAGADWLTQEEMTQALSEITALKRTIRSSMSAADKKAVVDWWVAHPTLDSVPRDE